MVFRARACVVALALVSVFVTAARADEESDFYKGRQVRLLIGFGPGGGYDLIARLVARRFGEHIPGAPQIVPQNVPGAGSLTAANDTRVTGLVMVTKNAEAPSPK